MSPPTTPNTLYRFRSIEALLDKYQELEKQTIYFASPDELNDPMEGLRDIFWRGDKIVWENFFKNYIYCLYGSYLLFRKTGDSKELDAYDIPIYGQWSHPPTPEGKRLFDNIWDRFYHLPSIPSIIDALANTNRKIRYRELRYYLRLMHSSVLNEIIESCIAHNILPESEGPEPNNVSLARVPLKKILPSIKRNEEAKTEEEIHLELLDIEAADNNHIIFWHLNNRTSLEKLRKNYQLVIYDFPNTYLRNIGRLLWPNWYTACFTKNYHNSSIWGHYGDQHRGVCLIYEFEKANQSNSLEFYQGAGKRVQAIPLFAINYVVKPGEVDFFSSISSLPDDALKKLWYTDGKGNISGCFPSDRDTWRKRYWKNFIHDVTIKTKDWEYEQEYRLILQDNFGQFGEEDKRSLFYNFNLLKGIIFGVNTSYEHKSRIIEIIQRKWEENDRTDFKFYQAYYSPEKGDIRKYEIYSRRWVEQRDMTGKGIDITDY